MRNLILTFLITCFSTAALSADWYSTAHVGFASERQSTTGFKNSSGSMAFLDIGYNLNESLGLGIRTLMQGGQKTELSYYRMGSGPMMHWKVAPEWIVHGSFTSFNETALNEGGDKAYMSKGRSLMLGWEKVRKITDSIDVVYGSFVTQHKGRIDLTSQISKEKNYNLRNITDNSGLSHGFEIAIQMFL